MRFITHHWRNAQRPERAEQCLDEHVFDDDLSVYLRMLLACAGLAALLQIVLTFGFALITLGRTGNEVDWWPLINVSATLGVGAFFLTLFIGTAALFLIALILHLLIRRKLIRIMHALILACAPFVLFGWIPIFTAGVALWSAALAIRLVRRRERTVEVLTRE